MPAEHAAAKDPQEEPDWSLLPGDPRAFFELDQGFDRKDLKRAYNRLLRRFKPERFPDEFQRLRAAYEQLDDGLRYGASADAGSLRGAAQDRSWDVPERPGGVQDSAEAQEHLAPSERYARLRGLPHPTAHDFFALAVLADVVADDAQGPGFAGWLIRGLEAHPSEPRLVRLLYAYCHRDVAPEEALLLVRDLAAVLTGMEFGFITERLWVRLMRGRDFGKVASLLEACWGRVRGRDPAGRIALTLRLTRRVALLADQEWIDEQVEFLRDHYDSRAGMDEELEVLELFLSYRAQRDALRNGDPVREEIDQVVRVLCEGDEVEADRAFLAFQVRYRAGADELLRALPWDERAGDAGLHVLRWYAWDLSGRLEPPAHGSKLRALAVPGFLQRLEKLTDRSIVHRLLSLTWLALLVGYGMTLFFAPALLFEMPASRSVEWGLAGGIWLAGIALFWFVLRRFVFGPLMDHTSRVDYRRIWRGELLDFLDREPVTLQEFLGLVEGNDDLIRMENARDLVALASTDAALGYASLMKNRR